MKTEQMEFSLRKGGWMQTFTGRQFWPVDPKPDEICIEDIAGPLSKLCRYSGHCRRFYSVAEHSVLVSRNVPEEYRMWGLLHDASEAYLADVVRPLKPFLSNYLDIENRLMFSVAQRFGLPWPLPRKVKEIDNRILLDEQAQLMAPPPAPWNIPGSPLGTHISGWCPEDAEDEFLAAFEEYGGHR